MSHPPVCLVVAGVDPSGGAGVAADLATCAAHRVWGAPVVTAVTVQDTVRVHAVAAVDAEIVRRQIEVVAEDLRPAAVKVGMLGSAAVVRAVTTALATVGCPIVIDPVLAASGGGALLDDDAITVLIEELLPLAALLTPNAVEAERLSGVRVDSPAAAEEAGRALLALGPQAVLVKGGHLDLGDGVAADCLLVEGSQPRWFDGPRLVGVATHGTGCVLSSAVAARLARGGGMVDAVAGAKTFVASAMAAGPMIGHGPGVLDPWRAGPC